MYAVDVGYGQLDYSLRQDSRVVVMERVNARYLLSEDLPESCRLAVFDVSFISVVKVVPAVSALLEDGGYLLPLIKPQFEAGKGKVGKGGIVRSAEQRQWIVEDCAAQIEALGLVTEGIVESPVAGAKGNRESFALFRRIR